MASTAIRTPRASDSGTTAWVFTGSGRGVFLGRLDLEDRATAVIPAIRAGAMTALRLVAVCAFLELWGFEREMCAPIPLASVGDPSLWHAHGIALLLSRTSSLCEGRSTRRAGATRSSCYVGRPGARGRGAEAGGDSCSAPPAPRG